MFHKRVMGDFSSKQHLMVIIVLKQDDQTVQGLFVFPTKGKARYNITQGAAIKNTEIISSK